jgi:hypothetical protein
VERWRELIEQVRARVDAIINLAIRMLDAGVDPDRVHRLYVSSALELGQEAEVQAVLASTGDANAVSQLELLERELRRLQREAGAEPSG